MRRFVRRFRGFHRGAQARADALAQFNDAPFAVLELKRPGVPLTVDDDEQDLSYARMLHPRPPLVLVTSGEATRQLATRDGLSGSRKRHLNRNSLV